MFRYSCRTGYLSDHYKKKCILRFTVQGHPRTVWPLACFQYYCLLFLDPFHYYIIHIVIIRKPNAYSIRGISGCISSAQREAARDNQSFSIHCCICPSLDSQSSWLHRSTMDAAPSESNFTPHLYYIYFDRPCSSIKWLSYRDTRHETGSTCAELVSKRIRHFLLGPQRRGISGEFTSSYV